MIILRVRYHTPHTVTQNTHTQRRTKTSKKKKDSKRKPELNNGKPEKIQR